MKKTFFHALVIGLLFAGSLLTVSPAQGDDGKEPPVAKKTVKKNEVSEVAKAFKSARPVQGRLNPAAKCFVYLQSASWCGPCREEMPEIVKEYKEMKANGVEIILCGRDEDKKGVKGYIKEFKIPFPAVVANEKLKLPGYQRSPGVPHATFVDKSGKVLLDGHGAITMRWKEVIEKINAAEEQEEESEE